MRLSITLLLFAIVQTNAFAQIDLKCFLDASWVQYGINEIQDTNYINSKKRQMNFRPLISIAYNRKDKNFHELGISNIQYEKTDLESGSGNIQNQNLRSRSFGINFNYSYNYCFIKTLERWIPYVGVHADVNFGKSKAKEKIANLTHKTLRLGGNVGTTIGVQYAIRNYLKMELAFPINLYRASYNRINTANTSLPSGNQIRQSARYNGCSSNCRFVKKYYF